MSREAERFASQAVSLAGKERLYRAAKALEGRSPTITEADVRAIEKAADASMRAGEYQTALDAYSVALKLRSESGLHPLRRAGDA